MSDLTRILSALAEGDAGARDATAEDEQIEGAVSEDVESSSHASPQARTVGTTDSPTSTGRGYQGECSSGAWDGSGHDTCGRRSRFQNLFPPHRFSSSVRVGTYTRSPGSSL